MRKSDTIVVTGATGHQGGAVARQLLAKGHNVRAVTRHPKSDKAKQLIKLGADLVKADFDDSASMEKAMKGAWGIYAVQNTWEAGVEKEEEQGKRIAELARKTGIRHYVYASVGSADGNTGIPHFDNKYRVEETVRSLGFPSYTIVRPVFFMENWLGPWFKPGIDQGKIMTALKPDTKLQMIAVADIGQYGCWAFENHEKLNGRAIDIAGDSLTMPETAAAISKAAGRPVEFAPIPIEEVRKNSEDYALMLEWFDRVGYDADIEGMSRESGIKPTRFSDWSARANWKSEVAAAQRR
jgi:uncharacterized protein YbjT (DUF2867 family)